MKFFKKAREAFNRLVGRDENPPGYRPPPTPPPAEVEVIQDPRFKYRVEQRDLAARAKAVTVIHDVDAGPFNRGRNAAKLGGRAALIRAGASPRVAKRKQRSRIASEVAA